MAFRATFPNLAKLHWIVVEPDFILHTSVIADERTDEFEAWNY